MMQHILTTLKQKLHIGNFLSNVLILAGGTGLGQLIVVLATPVLTRLYAPEEFGVLTVFISSMGLMVVVAALRYEIAIPLPASSSTAINLTVLSTLITTGLSVLLGLVIIPFGPELARRFSVPQLTNYLWFFPVGMWAGGIFQVLSYWHIREKKFKRLTQAKAGQSAFTVAGQLLIGWGQTSAMGLVGGYILGRIIAGWWLFQSFLQQARYHFADITTTNLKMAAYRYRRFPLISSWSALLNQGGLQAAPLLFAAFFGAQVAGWFGLAQRVAGIPITLVGRSVSQVYLGEASRLRNENPAVMQRLFLRTSMKLFIFVGIPMFLAGLTAPWIFGFIFGEKWRISGWYIVALLPMFLGQIVVYPLSPTLNILERQDLQLIWDIARVTSVVLVILVAYYLLQLPSLPTLAIYSVTMLIMYIIRFAIMWRQLHFLTSATIAAE